MKEFRVYTPTTKLMWFGESVEDVRRQAELCGHNVVRVEFIRTHEITENSNG